MHSSLLALACALAVSAAPTPVEVDTAYAYTGPDVPVGDWVDPTAAGNGKGFHRIAEAPAVAPCVANPTNNINVISTNYVPGGMNIHFQTPYGLGTDPVVYYSTDPSNVNLTATGTTTTYDRTPPCSMLPATQCSQFFHDVEITGLVPGQIYFYTIPGGNGTTASSVLSFTTARAAGQDGEFSVAMLNDMGYTNAKGTHEQLLKAIADGVAFAWHGGDISYADDWYSGILPCADDWSICYNGSSTTIENVEVPYYYKVPLPAGEIANQGGPLGGDAAVIYESNWDEWQNWMNPITQYLPYMVAPGNHEAACAEFDGPNNELTAYLVNDKANSTAPESLLNYYSCPPSQRNFTAYTNRFSTPGKPTGGVVGQEAGGVQNFWYSFEYGLAKFITFDGETDYYSSPEWPFIADTEGNATHPTAEQTYETDSGPFGYIDGSYKDNGAYEQVRWMEQELASINRTETPWVFAMSHRPMYSSEVSSYQAHMRDAFQDLFIKYNVDVVVAGHIHWYERLWPLTANGTVAASAVIDNATYAAAPGSLIHLVNGQAGNVEAPSTLDPGDAVLNITAVLDFHHFGFTKLTVHNATHASWAFIHGQDGAVGDELMIVKA